MKLRISNIIYDEGHDELPVELTMTVDDELSEEEIDEEASDFISFQTGFCHKGFSLEQVK